MAKRLTLIPLQEKIKILTDSYVKLEQFIRGKLAGIKSFSSNTLQKKEREVLEAINRQDKINQKWVATYLPQAYRRASAYGKWQILRLPGRDASRPEPKKKLFEKVKGKEIDKSNARALEYMIEANRSYRFAIKTFFRSLRKTKKKLNIQNFVDHWGEKLNQNIDEIKEWSLELLPKVTRAGFKYEATPTLQEVKKRVTKAFADNFGDFDFIQVPLKKGGFRNYKPTKYITMVARSEMVQIQSQAVKDRCRQYDNDLVQFSEHANPCPICEPFGAQVFSISGKSKIYPPLQDEPPLHPHCEHHLQPVSLELIELEGEKGFPKKPDWGLTVESRLADLKKAA